MSGTHNPQHDERMYDLAIQSVLGQLEASDLDTLAQGDPSSQLRERLELETAAIDAAVAQSNPIDPPSGLMGRMMAQVDSYPPQSSSDSPSLAPVLRYTDAPRPQNATSSPVIARFSWMPWMIAAACVLITGLVLFVPAGGAPVRDPAAQRLALIESTPADQLIQWDWISTDDSSVVGEVIGDVVWSDRLNKGYMRISGLAINDPSLEQYQLWIFDATRPNADLPQFGEGLLTQRPIDGGVFDITSDGDVIIEIDAKLRVQQAAAFAVTVEPPGGVVVSDRSRVPLLALAK